ncbi:hypothetical protein CHS0354_011895 [Potamilus streckersoni]|uniref:Uncharacterized protein n=1 Tax=Potamilus streckersoni TaxID=2493646 RepID=A0AAE0T148_9BIVA|nr:hypothetical protein CHS0354_011895 [Potamilus streckersoni]
MISQVKLYHEQIKEKFSETETVRLNLEIDSQIRYILEQTADLGSVVCTKECRILHLSTAEKPLSEHQVVLDKYVEIKGPDDKTPMYTGVTFIPGDQIMLADWNNKRVLLLDSSYQLIASVTLPGDPWDICVVDHQEVAVSLPYQKKLQYMSVTNGILQPTRRVQTRFGFWGLVYAGKGRIVASGSCNDEGKHYWGVVMSDREGNSCHKFECQCKPSSTYAALNASFSRVYITIWNACSLYCFAMDGTRMYVYKPDSLKGPEGVSTDKDDNVYVAGCLSHNIHQLESDGTPIRIITQATVHHDVS